MRTQDVFLFMFIIMIFKRYINYNLTFIPLSSVLTYREKDRPARKGTTAGMFIC